jgi:hypothetical protein
MIYYAKQGNHLCLVSEEDHSEGKSLLCGEEMEVGSMSCGQSSQQDGVSSEGAAGKFFYMLVSRALVL